jgi:protein SCO1/2
MLLVAVIVVLSAALVFVAAFWEPVPPQAAARNQTFGQLTKAVTPTGGEFTLQGPQGPVALKDYRGKVVLLYFGYSYCPDVCPTSLSLMAQALAELEPAERERVQAIFISVDPERDTPDRLKEYAHFFHPGIIGLSGTSEQIAAVAEQYGSSYQKKKPNGEGLYAIDHSSATYVIGPKGQLASSLPHASPPSQIVAATRQQLAAW